MYAINQTKTHIISKANKALGLEDGFTSNDLVLPPNHDLGDFSLSGFILAKKLGKKPLEIMDELASKLQTDEIIQEITVVGPYINFKINYTEFTEKILGEIARHEAEYGKANKKNKKKIIVEFAHPNTHKAFHIGHLRNIVTGESIVRLLEAVGHKVIRANYQGDVGPHIAKCLWGVQKLAEEFEQAKKQPLNERVAFLGKAYVLGSKQYEISETAKAEIREINKKIYTKDNSVKELYETTREWSLKYFAEIYKQVNSKFDRLYFESEVFADGKKLVEGNLESGVFEKSQGAIIFPGEKYGLHSRVFVTKENTATYEAKDLALAKLQLKEYKPDKIIHVVGPEQSEYFKVVFKALEQIDPKSKGKEVHLPYGWVGLKNGKMSSRTGNVVLGQKLLSESQKKIKEISSKNNKISAEESGTKKIALAAIKYAFLRVDLNKKIDFDLNESVAISGDSGPYLLYTYARINSILKKAGEAKKADFSALEKPEKKIVLELARFPEIVSQAASSYEPALVARYLFDLAQNFSEYYHKTSIINSQGDVKSARLKLISGVKQVIKNGIELLGAEVVEKM